MAAITVREALQSDIPQIAVLLDAYRQFYGAASDLETAKAFLAERLKNEDSVLLLALDGTDCLGFTQLYPSYSSVSLARIYILNDLYVADSARRKGVGRELLKAAVEHARMLGALRLELSTAKTNYAAQTLYEEQSWVRDEEYFVYRYQIGV